MIEIILASLLSSIVIMGYGYVFCNFAFEKEYNKNNYYYELSIFGIILISFLALIINFFFPLNKYIGDFFLILGSFFFIIFYLKTNYKKKIFKYILITSVITFLLITLSNTYRPDAGLYHLPFISVINEKKIIIGLANVNFRFGLNSIIQYISGIYNTHIFSQSFITMPLASIFSIFILFNYKEIFFHFKNENYKISIILFCLLIFSLYSFNRYSNYGNDTPGHIFYFIIIIYLLKNEINHSNILFFKIAYISIFLFAIKAFMFLTLFFPFFLFLISKNKSKLIFNKNSFIIIIFLFSWLIKSVLTTGCFIYPVSQTCIKNLYIYDHEKTIFEAKSGEAWAKDWINQQEKLPKLQYDEYNKNFNWVKIWANNHLLKILEKTLPFFILLIILFLFLVGNYFFKKDNEHHKDHSNNLSILFLLIISLLFSIIWFIKFPLFRYGLGFLLTTIILGYAFIITPYLRYINSKKLYNIFIIFIFIGFFLFSTKNILRILYHKDTNYVDYPWPRIYSLDESKENTPLKFVEIKDNNQLMYFYSNGELCMYSKAPCSNYKIEKLKLKNYFSYFIYFKN